MHIHGNNINHQLDFTGLSWLKPSAAKFPQLGNGSLTPMPRKLKKASDNIAAGIVNVE